MTLRRVRIAALALALIAGVSAIWWAAVGRSSPIAEDAGTVRIVAAPAGPARPAPLAPAAPPLVSPPARAAVDPDPPAPHQEAAAPRHAEMGVVPAI